MGKKKGERPESEERNTWSSRRMRYLRLISAVLGIRTDGIRSLGFGGWRLFIFVRKTPCRGRKTAGW